MVHSASCACGFVARDGNNVIAFDMCNGEIGETRPHLSVRNRDLSKSGIRITESYQGRKVTVSEDREGDGHLSSQHVSIFVSLHWRAYIINKSLNLTSFTDDLLIRSLCPC